MANYLYTEVKVNGIDVGDYLIDWTHDEEWEIAIDVATVVLSSSVTDIITPSAGQLVTIKRGFAAATEEFVFEGQITQDKPEAAKIILICKGLLNEAIKAGQTKSYDKDIDTEVGIGSEIFKDLCDDAQLTYTPAKGITTDGTIINTGLTNPFLIRKFIQAEEDNYQKMNELAKRYNYTIRRTPSDGHVHFEPKGYTTYPITLNIGTEIPGQIKWKTNMEQLCNHVTINGATVYDKINPAVFSGPATEFTLLKTPEDTEVRDTSLTGTLYVRGQKDIGTIGTDFDYYVDVEAKKVIFGTNKSNVWIRYGAQVPMPVTLKNQTSIDTYGGPNKTPNKKKFTFPNLKDINDAEAKGRELLNKYSTPFVEAENIPVTDDVLQTNGVIEPGNVINIIDSYNNKNVSVFVKIVRKKLTTPNDEITIGDEIWRTEDWQMTQMEKINLLLNELNKNQDILISTKDLNRDYVYERRYSYLEKTNITDSFILGHPSYGVLGTSKLGAGVTVTTREKICQGNNILKEFMYDDDLIDAGATTATLDTTNNTITF